MNNHSIHPDAEYHPDAVFKVFRDGTKVATLTKEKVLDALKRQGTTIHPALGTNPKPGEPELHLLLVLSTEHLSSSAHVALYGLTENNSREAGPGCYADRYKYGYHLSLTTDDSGGEWCDDCVKDIVTYAISIGATHVRLDADGPIVSALPTY